MTTQSGGGVADPRHNLLPYLRGVQRAGDGWTAFCPAHPDGQKHGKHGGQSLSISREGLVNCFAGCDFEEIMRVIRSDDRQPEDFRSEHEPKRHSWDWGEPVRLYEYRKPLSGELIAIKARYEHPDPDGGKAAKKFGWRLPDSTYDKGIRPLTMADMPLFGAETVHATKDKRVWFAEGEKATEAIRAQGELAVCAAGGASQQDFGDALEILRGRHVILWPDNDADGRQFMHRIRLALHHIAASVTVVTADVPPKGDAYEYFAKGGTLDALLEGVIIEPAIDVLGMDTFRVRIPTAHGLVTFDFANMARARSSLEAELTVRHEAPQAETEPYSQRINILSQSARQSLERALGTQFGKKDINWTTVVSIAYARVQKAYFGQDRGIPIGQLPDQNALDFLIPPFLPLEQAAVIFGDGGSGKTYFTYGMALAVALGGKGAFGFRPYRQGGVLIIDYENPNGATLRFRFKRLLRGAGLDPLIVDDLPIHYWPGSGMPLPDHVEALKRYIDKYLIQLVIVDSGAPASPGKPEDAQAATLYFNAANQLGVTTLTICHISKSDPDVVPQYPFGSIFWSHLPRSTWYMERDERTAPDRIYVGLYDRKHNDRGQLPPLGYAFVFGDDGGPVRIVPSQGEL